MNWGESWLGAAARELAAHWLAGGEQLHCTSLVLHFFYHCYYYFHYFPFLFCPIKLSLPQPINFTFFSRFSPPSHWQGASEWLCGV